MLACAGVTVAESGRGLYTLSGTLGLRWKDYDYERQNRTYRRSSLREELGLSAGGFVWDPRFMTFDASATWNTEQVRQSEADRDYENTDYRLSTRWFPKKPWALTLHGGRSTSDVNDETAPSYRLTTRNYGARWGYTSALLGRLQLSFDTAEQMSESSEVERDEESRVVKVDGKRDFGDRRDPGAVSSDLSYGYRYNEDENRTTGYTHRQHYWYGQNRTLLSERSSLSANFTLYDRQDTWEALPERESLYFNASSSLSTRHTEATQSGLNLALSRNETDGSETDSYSGSARVDHQYNPRWSLNGAARLSGTRYSGDGGGERTTLGGDAGARYANRFGNFLVNGGYTLGMERVTDERSGNESALDHSFSLGYTRGSTPLYADALDYRGALRYGDLDTREHSLRYRVNSQLGRRDRLTATAEVRQYEEEGGTTPRDSLSKRASTEWSHRLYNNGSLALGAGWSESTIDESRQERSHLQARLGFSPRRIARLRLTALARYEEETGESAGAESRTTLEASANYTIGRWQTRAEYRYREEEDENGYNESEVMLYLKRNFSSRF